MKIHSVSPSAFVSSRIQTAKSQLQALAREYNTDVASLLHGAHTAGSSALPYQIRALNLETRMLTMNEDISQPNT